MPSDLAILEIAGRDSVAAAIAAVRERGFTTLIPTVGLVGTEYGDQKAPVRAMAHLAERLGPDVVLLDPLWLSVQPLWAALNSRFATVIQERFGVHSPCLACHLYLHLLRVPLAWSQGNAPVVAGERDAHADRLKLSQTPLAIDASVEVLAYAGIELLQPIRRIADAAEIDSLVGPGFGGEGPEQLECVLSGNYLDLEGCVRYDEAGYERYVREFFVPAGKAIVDAWRQAGIDCDPAAREPDYAAVVRGVLEG